MAENNIETEIKIKINSIKPLLNKLTKLHAKQLKSVKQTDILWDYTQEGKTFETLDQSLRLRLEYQKGKKQAIFTFKGTPTLDKHGIKTRDEYNTEIFEPKAFKKILYSIGFHEALTIIKKRRMFLLKNTEVCIDELKFGNFIELEGKKKDINIVIELLDLQNKSPEKKPYYLLQLEWERTQ